MGAWRQHTVRPGECVISLAAECGITPEALWGAPENAPLREQRGSAAVLRAGDSIMLPAAPAAAVLEANSINRYGGELARTRLRLRLVATQPRDTPPAANMRMSRNGSVTEYEEPEPPSPAAPEPLADVPYCLKVGSIEYNGATDGDGVLQAEVAATAMRATLTLYPHQPNEQTLAVAIGHLAPSDVPAGVRQRLAHLGLSIDADDEALHAGVGAFQKLHNITETGDVDEATSAVLADKHGA